MRRNLTTQQKLYLDLRSRLVRRGISLRRWARLNGYPPTTVYSAFTRPRRSMLSQRIIRELARLD